MASRHHPCLPDAEDGGCTWSFREFSFVRQLGYDFLILEQDHRAVKRVTHPMMGFKSYDAAQSTWAGIERIPMLLKGRWEARAE